MRLDLLAMLDIRANDHQSADFRDSATFTNARGAISSDLKTLKEGLQKTSQTGAETPPR